MFNDMVLKIRIAFSRKMPKLYKKEISKKLNIINTNLPWGNGLSKKIKDLYCFGMFNRSYDIFRTSIYAYLENNEMSSHILLRSQLENIFYTNYFVQNPNEIDKSVDYNFYENHKGIDFFRKDMKNDDYWKSYYKFLCDRTHPSAEGLKSRFMNMFFLNPEEMKWEPTLSIKPKEQMSDEDKIIGIKNVIITFNEIINNLKRISRECPNHEIDNYKIMHRKDPKEYLKNKFCL